MKPTTITVDHRYSAPGAVAPDWADLETALASAEVYALTTVMPNCSPHTVPVAGLWTDDGFVFSSGEGEQKIANIAANPQVSMHIGSTSFMSGMDIVVRGIATQHNDVESLEQFSQGLAGKYPDSFRFTVQGESLVNPHGDRVLVFRLQPDVVYAFRHVQDPAQVKYSFAPVS